MTDVSIHFKTSISNVFFYADEDENRFYEWFNDKLADLGLFKWEMIDNPVGLPGITKLTVYVNEFSDYDHDICAIVDVDDGTHSFEEIYTNQDLLDYIDRELAPRIIDELNALLDISIPTNGGKSFSDLKFDDGEFYSVLHHTAQYGYFVAPHIEDTKFQVVYDFEVYV